METTSGRYGFEIYYGNFTSAMELCLGFHRPKPTIALSKDSW